MKRIFVLLALFAVKAGFAQQLPLYSQYMFNPYLINPAVAGTLPYTPVNLGIRSQWVGFKDAPRTQVLSVHGLKNFKHGLGGFLFNDKTGPLSRTGAQFSYAYHMQVMDNGAKLALGAAALLYQNKLDRSKLDFDSDLDNADDPVMMQGEERAVSPDATFGAYFYHEKYFAGISVPHLLQSPIRVTETQDNPSRLFRHYFATAGYRYSINYDFTLEPSVLLKAVSGAPMQLDVNTKVAYQRSLWAGVSYRHKDALVAMLGANKGSLGIGYSYDFTLSQIKTVSGGSHEIFLAYNIGATRPRPTSTPTKLPEPGKEKQEEKDGDELGPDEKKQPEIGPDEKKKEGEQKPGEAKPEEKKPAPKTTPGGKKKL